MDFEIGSPSKGTVALALILLFIVDARPLLANRVEVPCELTEVLSKPEKMSTELLGYKLLIRLEKDRRGRNGDTLLIENAAEEPFVTCELQLPTWFKKAYFSARTRKMILLQSDPNYSVLGSVSLKECAYIPGPSLYGVVSLRDKALFEKYDCGGEVKESCGKDIPVKIDLDCKILSQTN